MHAIEKLEGALLNLRAQDTIIIYGTTYSVQNAACATDGKVLQAHLTLLQDQTLDQFLTIDISAKAYDVSTAKTTNNDSFITEVTKI